MLKLHLLLVCLVGFSMSSSVTRLSCGQVARLKSDNFKCCHTQKEQEDHDFCLNLSTYTDTDPINRERSRGSNQRSPDQESHALSTELPHPLFFWSDFTQKIVYFIYIHLIFKFWKLAKMKLNAKSSICVVVGNISWVKPEITTNLLWSSC